MKAEQLHESVRPATVIVVGLTLAIIFGSMVGKGEPKVVFAFFAAVFAVLLLLAVRQRIWMVIPAVWMLGGRVSLLPLPFTVTQLGVLLAFGTYLVLKALKINRFKPKMGTLEGWLLVMILYVVTEFVRNPVGVEALGADRVGGRPYFDALIACLAFWVLVRSVATPKQALIFPFLSLAGHGFHTVLNFVADHFPSLAAPLADLYSDITAAETPDWTPTSVEGGGRLSYLQGIGGSVVMTVCSFWRPLTLINPLYIWRFLSFILGTWFVLLSGFRSSLFGVILIFLTTSYFRRGIVEAIRICAMGAGLLLFLIMIQGSVIQLPFAAQRTLSFLPGNWDQAAKAEAENSTEWRVTMWKAMLDSDKYIHNKWLGDGFGFSRKDLEIMNANQETGSNEEQQENLMISGGVHSGPISTIRYVGYVGLALFMILLILTAIKAARLIRRAQGTPFYPLAFFVGIPSIIYPFAFTFIFGAFNTDLPNTILGIAMLRMLENSLDAYQGSPEKLPAREVVQPPKARLPRQFAPVGQAS